MSFMRRPHRQFFLLIQSPLALQQNWSLNINSFMVLSACDLLSFIVSTKITIYIGYIGWGRLLHIYFEYLSLLFPCTIFPRMYNSQSTYLQIIAICAVPSCLRRFPLGIWFLRTLGMSRFKWLPKVEHALNAGLTSKQITKIALPSQRPAYCQYHNIVTVDCYPPSGFPSRTSLGTHIWWKGNTFCNLRLPSWPTFPSRTSTR